MQNCQPIIYGFKSNHVSYEYTQLKISQSYHYRMEMLIHIYLVIHTYSIYPFHRARCLEQLSLVLFSVLCESLL